MEYFLNKVALILLTLKIRVEEKELDRFFFRCFLRFSDFFRGYRSGTLIENGLKLSLILAIFLKHFSKVSWKTVAQ